MSDSTCAERLSDVARRVSGRRLRQCESGTDGDTRQREADERDCRPVAIAVGGGVEPAEAGRNAEPDSDRGQAASESQSSNPCRTTSRAAVPARWIPVVVGAVAGAALAGIGRLFGAIRKSVAMPSHGQRPVRVVH
jgi:hypothetical protein